MWIQIIKRLKAINNVCKKEFAVDYHDLSLDGLWIDLPLDKMIKFNAIIISIRLIIEVDDKYISLVYLEECLYGTV